MDALNDPATESQLNLLRQFHYEPDHPLSRVEAAQLIGELRRHPEGGGLMTPRPALQTADPPPYGLRMAVQNARQALLQATASRLAECEHRLNSAIQKRQEFWMDTCRDPIDMKTHVTEVRELYMKHGCQFIVPTHEQVQEILDALDSALPDWDRNRADLFYQTLELNFPVLRRFS